jgi:hypothetical protein
MRDPEPRPAPPPASTVTTAQPRRALRWVLLLGLAAYCSVRPAPLPLEVLFGSTAADPTAPPGAERAATDAAGKMVASHPALLTVDWGVLGLLDHRTATVPPALARLNGTRVRIPGFIVPLEDWQESATEFLLVPYFGACVHTPPPPPNQMVYVHFAGDPQALSLFDPVWVEGTLEVRSIESPYGAVSYTLRGQRLVPYVDDR